MGIQGSKEMENIYYFVMHLMHYQISVCITIFRGALQDLGAHYNKNGIFLAGKMMIDFFFIRIILIMLRSCRVKQVKDGRIIEAKHLSKNIYFFKKNPKPKTRTIANPSHQGKVMFSEASVILSTEG